MPNLLPVSKYLLILCLLACGAAQAQATGGMDENLRVFVFKEGEAQRDISISVGPTVKTTDRFGMAGFALPAGHYEIGYFKDQELFAVTEVDLLADVSSQVFLTLTGSGAEVELDLPLTEYRQTFEKRQVREQEGPKGTLEVALTDSRSGEPVAGARLFVKGYAVEARSGEDGIARVELAEGEYDLSVVHPKYVMQVIEDVGVTAEASSKARAKLVKSDIVMESFVVTAPSVEGSLASTLTDLKDDNVLADAISSEQFSKSGDSSASGALKRVTGITIVDGKFVYIRGLGERYSTVLLNDLHIPSPEPTKRVVPLDIFPTSVIQNMKIQKTHSADLPGTFAGGTVAINTRDIPEEDNYVKLSVSGSVNESTGQSAVYNPDNAKGVPAILLDKSDDFGVLTEEVVLGDQVLAEGLTAEEKEQLNDAMMSYRSYGLDERTIKPGMSITGSAGQRFKTSGGLSYGFAGAVYYKTDEDSRAIKKDEYQYDPVNDEHIHIQSDAYSLTELEEKYGGMISLGVDDEENHRVKYTLLALSEANDITNFGEKEKLTENTFHERAFLQYTEKELFAHQFNGEHRFGGEASAGLFDDVVLDWGAETATATRLEPGTFEYEYKDHADGMVIDAKKLYYLYSDLEDEVDNYRLDLELPFVHNGRDNHTRIGLFDYKKARSLDNRRFKVEYAETLDPRPIDEALTEEAVDEGTADVLDAYKPDDFYTADQHVQAVYLSQLYSPLESVDVTAGLRQEKSVQELQVGEEETTYDLETSDVFPSLAGTWRISEQHQLRLGYSRTISRPDFREFSPNRYKDPLTGYIIYGYEGLEPTYVDNLDLKYEWYPSYDEFFSAALFVKDFENPIETVRTISDVDIETSYRNAQSAQSLGLELGFRKRMDDFWERLEHFYVSGNYALIESEISLDKDAPENRDDQFIPYLTTESRPMQGQSPYVLNLQFGYDNYHTRRSAVLLYNVYGERISALGINGNPDIYEEPFHKLDFVLKWGLNDTYDEQRKKLGYTLSFKAKNLLDSAVTMKQGGKTTQEYEPGRSFSLGLSVKY